MATRQFVGMLALATILSAGSAVAAEETLKFRLVVTGDPAATVQVPNIEGRSLYAGHYTGVAVLEDGRIAFKDFVGVTDNGGSEGNFFGYSTYTFLNGHSLTLKYTGDWGAKGFVGNYEVLSGTGAYEGAAGTGQFDTVEEPWDGAYLYDVTIKLINSDS